MLFSRYKVLYPLYFLNTSLIFLAIDHIFLKHFYIIPFYSYFCIKKSTIQRLFLILLFLLDPRTRQGQAKITKPRLIRVPMANQGWIKISGNFLHCAKRKGDHKGRPYKNRFSFFTLHCENFLPVVLIRPFKKRP
jgi:hypothetical protein